MPMAGMKRNVSRIVFSASAQSGMANTKRFSAIAEFKAEDCEDKQKCDTVSGHNWPRTDHHSIDQPEENTQNERDIRHERNACCIPIPDNPDDLWNPAQGGNHGSKAADKLDMERHGSIFQKGGMQLIYEQILLKNTAESCRKVRARQIYFCAFLHAIALRPAAAQEGRLRVTPRQ
jgi:hypothetical protein